MAGFEDLKVSAEELAAGLPAGTETGTMEEPIVVPGTENDPQFAEEGNEEPGSDEGPRAFDPEEEARKIAAEAAKANKEAGEQSSAEGNIIPTQPNTPPSTTEEVVQKDSLAEFLEKYGLKSPEELAEKLIELGKKPETPEEIERRQRSYRAAVDQYAQTNGHITREEILQLESLKAMKPEDVVWNKFKSEWIAANPDHDKANIDEDARLDFEAQYHINSENTLLKAQGVKNLQRDRDEIVNPIEAKYNAAETEYNDHNTQQQQVAPFAKIIQDTISGIPKEMKFGDGEESTVFQLEGKVDSKELENFLIKQDLWEKYLNKEDISGDLKEAVEYFVWKKNKNEIASEIRKSGYSAGLKKGSNVGASAPFEAGRVAATPVAPGDLTVEDRAKAAKAFGGR